MQGDASIFLNVEIDDTARHRVAHLDRAQNTQNMKPCATLTEGLTSSRCASSQHHCREALACLSVIGLQLSFHDATIIQDAVDLNDDATENAKHELKQHVLTDSHPNEIVPTAWYFDKLDTSPSRTMWTRATSNFESPLLP